MANKIIIVMSGSYGGREIINDIRTKYRGEADAIFHNGDSKLPSSDTIWEGIKVVHSNCSYDNGYPERLATYLSDTVVAQTHDHLYNISFTWDRLDLFAQKTDADICLYSHLHHPAAWRNGKTTFISPGGILQLRGDVEEKLYAEVDIIDDKIKVSYYTRNHDLLPAFSKGFDR